MDRFITSCLVLVIYSLRRRTVKNPSKAMYWYVPPLRPWRTCTLLYCVLFGGASRHTWILPWLRDSVRRWSVVLQSRRFTVGTVTRWIVPCTSQRKINWPSRGMVTVTWPTFKNIWTTLPSLVQTKLVISNLVRRWILASTSQWNMNCLLRGRGHWSGSH